MSATRQGIMSAAGILVQEIQGKGGRKGKTGKIQRSRKEEREEKDERIRKKKMDMLFSLHEDMRLKND